MKEYHVAIFDDGNSEKITYKCDHRLNTSCSKSNCKYLNRGECDSTTKQEFARDYLKEIKPKKRLTFYQKLFERENKQ